MNVSYNITQTSHIAHETFIDGNGTKNDHDGTFYYNIFATIYLTLLAPAIICGNIITILVLFRGKCMHKEACYIICSLALADLLIGLFTVPAYLFYLQSWFTYLARPYCMMIIASSLFLTAASLMNLLLVSCERYLAVCHVLLHLKIWKKKLYLFFLVMLIWIASILLTLLLLSTAKWDFDSCAYYNIFDKTTLTVTIGVGVLVPGGLMAFMYHQIFKKTKKHLTIMYQASITSGSSLAHYHQRQTSQKAMKMVKTLILVLVCFVICWGPFLLAMFLWSVCPWCALPKIANEVILLLGFTNSFLNPCVYCLRHKSFRRTLRSMICSRTQPKLNAKMRKSKSLSLWNGK